VISTTENSNNSKKPGFGRKNQLRTDVVTLGPMAQAALVNMK
jgi:hypothetical protein